MLSDLRFALRQLIKSPGFTIVALLTLSLSLGANTAIFSFVNAVLLRPLPYDEPDRIVRVLEKPPGGGRNGISTLNFLDWQSQNNCFEFLAANAGGSVSLTGIDEAVQISGRRVSAQFFDIFGVKAAKGRTFLEGEDQAGQDKVAVISHGLWQSQFGGADDIVGQSLHLDGEPHTVIGVLPRDTPFERQSAKIWRPLTFEPANMTRNFHWFGALARLKEGVTLEQARAEMDAIGARIANDFPVSNKDWGVTIDPFAETIVGDDLRQSLYVLLAAVGMVLLIACANLANLSLMRVVGREREIAIRVSMGAGRSVLMRQFLTESLLISLLGGALGILVGQLAMVGLQAAMPPFSLPSEAGVNLDGRVLLFSFGLTLITGIVVGLFPALHAARPNLTQSLKQGGGGAGTSRSVSRVRSTLVVLEVALAFILLTGSGLLMRSLNQLGDVDTGFDATNVLTLRLPISDKNHPDPEDLTAYLRELRSRIGALPGVTDVAMTSSLPMQGWGYGMPFQIADQEVIDRANRTACFFKMVSPSYFQTLKIKLRRGRSLAETDVQGSPPAAVISEAMVARYFNGEDPIGKRILVQEIVPGKTQLGEEIPWEVVGVVANEAVTGLEGQTEGNPGMYVTNYQSPIYGQGVVIRSAIDTTLLRQAVTTAVHEVNRDQTITGMKTLDVIVSESLGDNRFRVLLFGTFSWVSLLLSAIGIYGVISFAVSQRTRELGIRSALGASEGNILRLVLGNGLTLIAIGLVVGLLGALALHRFISALLFNVSGRDPVIMIAVALILALVGLIACFLPARRASKVNPTVALRVE